MTWIEELMGRRTSLKADAVIAVSAPGFTKTARDKANAHGIHLRDFATLSREEIQNWGRKRTLTLNFCEFTDVTLMVRASEPPGPGRPQLTDTEGKSPNPLTWRLLYQSVMQNLDNGKWTGVPATVNAEVGASLLVNGIPPTSMSLHTRVRRVSQSVQLASVVVYADPISATSHAEVGHYELGASEIIENDGTPQDACARMLVHICRPSYNTTSPCSIAACIGPKLSPPAETLSSFRLPDV